MSVKKEYYQIKAENIIKNFAHRNIEAFYTADSEAARKKIVELLKEEATISWGGSQTLKQIGILDYLRNENYQLLDRTEAKTPSEKEDIYYQAFASDYYLMSSNAVTQDGKLVNIDGNGNRLAALLYGPKNVIIIVGMNKVVSDEDSAVKRVKNQAASANAMRLNLDTPCTKTAHCSSCQVNDTICCQTVITRRSRQKGRIKVILVGESLGF